MRPSLEVRAQRTSVFTSLSFRGCTRAEHAGKLDSQSPVSIHGDSTSRTSTDTPAREGAPRVSVVVALPFAEPFPGFSERKLANQCTAKVS